jgi:nucleoside-diphosphate-sugar epimerase
MKVAVTGAGGFIGSALCPLLIRQGHDVRRTERNALHDLDAEAVVHLAAIAHRHAGEDELQRVNVDLSVQVARAAAAAGARMVFLSSLKVHGEESEQPLSEAAPLAPRDPYARSKARAEEALRAIPGLRLTVLRPPLVYGPGVKANFLALLKAVARGVPLPLASVANRRSVIYVGNLVHAIARCIEGEGGIYVVSDGVALSSAELCSQLGEALGRPARLFAFPTVFLPAKLRQSLIADDGTIRRELGWTPPYSQQEGLRATARWYLGR